MFENGLSELDAVATIAAVEDNERVAVETEFRRLLIALHWADLHPGEAVDPEGLPGRERPRLVGGAGTPAVADFRLASLGTASKPPPAARPGCWATRSICGTACPKPGERCGPGRGRCIRPAGSPTPPAD